jgi:hypothetical protein
MNKLFIRMRAWMFIVAFMVPVMAQAQATFSLTGTNTCWKNSYGRGFATVPNCAPGEQNSAGLCYPNCKSGFVGVGAVCWQSCPPGWQDIGVSCTKPNTISRPPFPMQQTSYAAQTGVPSGFNCSGVTWPRGYLNASTGALRQGYDPIPSSGPQAMQAGEIAVNLGAPFYDPRLDNLNAGAQCWVCPAGYTRSASGVTSNNACYVAGGTNNLACNAWSSANGGPGNCQQIGLLLYPNLSSNYNCTLDTCTISCPSGYTDNGLFCAKSINYTRAISSIPEICPSGDSYDAGLCYPNCKPGFSGVGPLCWAACQAGTKYPVECGAACAQDTPSCAVDITDQVLATLDVISNVIQLVATGGAGAAATTIKDAMNNAINNGVKEAVKELAGKVSKEVVVKQLKEMAIEKGITLAEQTPDVVGDLLTQSNFSFDWTTFDPTGISGLISAFYRPLCSQVQGVPALIGKWGQFSGSATQVAVGRSGVIWAIGVDTQPGGSSIYRMVNNQWQKMPGAAVRVAVDPNGNAWVLNKSNQIFRWNGSQFVQMPGAASDIAIGDNGQVWVIGTQVQSGGFALSYWTGTAWALGSGAGVHIAVDPNGNPWVINNAGTIFAYSGSQWNQLPGQASQIAIGNNISYVLGVDTQSGGHSIYYWTGSAWASIPGALSQIAVQPNGMPIGVGLNQNIYQYQVGP